MTFLEIALSCIQRGWYVFPCWPGDKPPLIPKKQGGNGYLDATLDEAQVRAWWTKCPNANPGIAGGASDITVMDCDHGLASREEVLAWIERVQEGEDGRKLPRTYTVLTGRRVSKEDPSKPEYGVQLYYKKAIPGSGHFDLCGCSGDVQSIGDYVMSAGSLHPSGEVYEVLVDAPLAPLPEWVELLEPQKKVRRSEIVTVDDATADEWKAWLLEYMYHNGIALRNFEKRVPNGYWLGIQCPWEHRSGDGAESSTVLGILDGKIAYECSHGTCKAAKRDTAVFRAEMIRLHGEQKPEPGADPIVVLGSGKTQQVEVLDDAEPLTDVARPVYPVEVWAGTPYGEFADLSAADNYVPKKFFIEAIRTVTGAIVGDKLSSSGRGINPRAYTILIAPPGSGKGTSFDAVLDFFGERWEGLTRTESPLLWDNPKEFLWRGRGIGAQKISPASAPGLILAIEEKKPKNGDTPNPLAEWKPMPRVITMSEEVRALFANFQNESTGAGLESVLCELYDRESFTSTATKDREPKSGRLMYSMLGGITPDGWTNVFSKTESTESGFLSRVNIVGTENTITVSHITPPDYGPLRNKLFPLIRDLELNPKKLLPSKEAKDRMDKWYNGLVMPEGISKARLNIHAWRTALHLAWLHGHDLITQEDAEGGLRLAEYLAKMREHYAPPEGETRGARCEAAIRKVMVSKRRVTVRELKQRTNFKRYGLGLWDKALKSLVQAGEVRIAETDTGHGLRKDVILLKQKE